MKENKRMNLLTMEHITKAYTDRVLLNDVAFSINENEKIGVIGINGMGKSTLLKVTAGIEPYDEGKISMGKQVKICYLPQTPEFEEGTTVLRAAIADNVNELNQWTIEADARSMLNQLGFYDYDEKVEHMSGGQKKRIALVNALLTPADILILDEPTNHLDNAMSEWLEEYLIGFRGAILMVTHDRYFLDRVATRIVEVDQGKLYSYPGNYSEFVKLKAERQDMALATERKRKSLLRTELEWLGRGARARSTKQKAHIDRIKAMQEIKDIQEEKRVVLDSVASRMGNKTIELENISKSYGNRKLISDYSYIFLKNDRIGIIGPNGCGKTTLLKIINGIVRPDSGTIEIGQTIRIGYFSQENEYMDASMKVIDYVKEVGEYVTTSDGKITASQMLERFLFDGAMQWSKIEKLSGGEKRRLYLMRVLMSAPNVLILDEPTNDLDIQTLTILEDYLDHFDGIIITVSHDRYFLDRIVNRIFSFEGDGKVRQFEGGYSDYLIRKELEGLDTEMSLKGHAAATEEQSTKGESSSKDTWKQRKPKLKFTYKEQREFETIDDDIAKLEEKLETLDAQIAANATNSVKLRELMDKKEEAGNELDEKMERWVYLNDLNEKIQNADITRERLKTNGRIAFKKNYWSCVAVAVIMGIITGLSGVNGGRAGGSASQNSLYGTDGFGYLFAGLAITMAAIIVTLIILALEIFVGSLLEVGGKRFFVLNKTENPTVGTIFDAFRSGHYVNVVLVMFLKNLFTSLWTLLFVIPGIVKHYEYLMIPYILAENPGMDRKEAFQISKRMMDGQKMETFILDLSFIGWILLSAITCGIVGIFYVNPYREATFAELYAFNKAKAYEEGYIR